MRRTNDLALCCLALTALLWAPPPATAGTPTVPTGTIRASQLEISMDQVDPMGGTICAQVGLFFRLDSTSAGSPDFSFDYAEFSLAMPGDAGPMPFAAGPPRIFIGNLDMNPGGFDGLTDPPIQQVSVLDGMSVPCTSGTLFNEVSLGGLPDVSYVDRGGTPTGSESVTGDHIMGAAIRGVSNGPGPAGPLVPGDEILIGTVVVPINPQVGEVPLQVVPFPPSFNRFVNNTTMELIWPIDDSLQLEDGFVRIVPGTATDVPALSASGLALLALLLACAAVGSLRTFR